jgi:hypothetical protein
MDKLKFIHIYLIKWHLKLCLYIKVKLQELNVVQMVDMYFQLVLMVHYLYIKYQKYQMMVKYMHLKQVLKQKNKWMI